MDMEEHKNFTRELARTTPFPIAVITFNWTWFSDNLGDKISWKHKRKMFEHVLTISQATLTSIDVVCSEFIQTIMVKKLTRFQKVKRWFSNIIEKIWTYITKG